MYVSDYKIPFNSISTIYLQAIEIVERVDQIFGNITHTFIVLEIDLEDEKPWEGIISSTTFITRSIVHTSTRQPPSQLGRYLVGTQLFRSTREPTCS